MKNELFPIYRGENNWSVIIKLDGQFTRSLNGPGLCRAWFGKPMAAIEAFARAFA